MNNIVDVEITRIQSLMYEQTGYEGRLEKIFSEPESAQKYLDTFVIRDTHSALMLTSIVTGLFGMLPTPLSPILFGISLAADLADAALYASEGQGYTAGVLAALSIIPGHQLFKQIKNLKTIERVGIEEAKRLLLQEAKNLGTIAEKRTAKQIIKEMMDNAKQISFLVVKETTKRFVTNLMKKSLKFVLNFILFLFKGSFELSKQMVIIGGSIISFDKLYLLVFRDDPQLMAMRNDSKFKKLIDLIEGNEVNIKEQLLSSVFPKIEEQIKEGKPIVEYNGSEKANKEFVSNYLSNLNKERVERSKIPPTIEEVLNGKINPETNTPVTLHKGQRGSTIKTLQKYLRQLEYEHILTGMGIFESSEDGIFGDWTKKAVIEFQTDNSLVPVDGIVGKQTLSKIINKLEQIKK